MEFFGMGTGEILLVIIVALIIWGPGKLPEIARTMGKTISALKQTSSDLTTQIKKELDEADESKKTHAPLPVIKSQTVKVEPLTPNTSEHSTGED